MKKLALILMLFTCLISCKKGDTDGNGEVGTYTDSRDGQVYPFKQIGSQVWMTQNLNYAVVGSRCYDNSADYCATYGRLYDWKTALTVAPAGWHLPSDAEWTILTDFLGGESKAGGKMKATTFWVGANTGATNISGFTALPGGFSQADYVFDYIGFHGDWWSSTKSDPDFAWMRYIDAYPFGVVWRKYSPTIIALSVRCLRD